MRHSAFPLAAVALLLAAVGQSASGSGVALGHDGGATWELQLLPPDWTWTAIAAAGPAAVWVACVESSGSPGSGTDSQVQLLVSNDAGVSWASEVAPITGYPLPTRFLAAASPDDLWLRPAPDALWHSANGGAAWSEVTPVLPSA